MMRRGKREKPRPEPSAPQAPARPPTVDEAARTIEQPVVPGSGEPEPSEQVLDELLSFFGVRHHHPHHHPHHHHQGESQRAASAPSRPTSTEPPSAPVLAAAPPSAAGEAPPTPGAAADSESPSAEPDLPVAVPIEPVVPIDPAVPAVPAVPVEPPAPGVAASPTEFGLVRAPTKRQTRRSAREAKREQKAQEKRLAELAKQRRKSAKKAGKKAGKKSGKKAGTGDTAAVDGLGGVDAVEGVRIISGPAPASPAPAPVDAGSADAPPTSMTPGEPAIGPPLVEASAERATVSLGGDDDLPDAVYLEGSLDGDGAGDRGTVFIDDKDPATGAMVSMEVATSVNRIEPRLRDRRIAVKRAVGRKRLRWIALATAVVGVLVAGLAVLGSGLFAIDTVRVEGAVYSVGPELDAIVADLDGQNVLRVDTDAIESELRRIPWVEDARVSTDFPHGATIELRERVPVVAYLGPDQKYRVLDDSGRVITILDGRPTDYLELMVDTSEAPNLAAGALAPEGYRAAATLVTALVDPLRPLVESLTVDVAGTDLRMHLSNGIEVRFGAAEALQDKLVRLAVALIETDPEMAPTTMIDVSTPDIVTQ